MVSNKVVLALDTLNIIVILPHFKNPPIHSRGFGLSLENTSEGLVICNYGESGSPKIMMKIPTGQYNS